MRRLSISLHIEFGKDDDEPDQTPVGADSSHERRGAEDHDARTIGFGRPSWEGA